MAAVRDAVCGKAAILTCKATTKEYTELAGAWGAKSCKRSIGQRSGGGATPALLFWPLTSWLTPGCASPADRRMYDRAENTAPPAPLAENFRGADNRSVKSGPLEYEHWWTGFRDPTLNRLIQIAYNQNLTLESAGRSLQARAVLGIAIGITYPQVQQGVGSVIYNRTSAATPLAGPNATPSHFWTDALAAQAAWELDFWGKFRRGVDLPIARIWRRSQAMTAFSSRFWRTSPQLTLVSAPQSSSSELHGPTSAGKNRPLVLQRQNLQAAGLPSSMFFRRQTCSSRRVPQYLN